MTIAERLKEYSVEFADITDAICNMAERQSLLQFDGPVVQPVYAKKILKLFLLTEWPVFNGEVSSWMRFYAALLPHGRTHIVEVYLMQEEAEASGTGKYLGTFRVYTVNLPDPKMIDKNEEIGALISDFLADALGLQG